MPKLCQQGSAFSDREEKEWQRDQGIGEEYRHRPRRFIAAAIKIGSGAMVEDMSGIDEDVWDIGKEQDEEGEEEQEAQFLKQRNSAPVFLSVLFFEEEDDAGGKGEEEEIPEGTEKCEHQIKKVLLLAYTSEKNSR